MSLDDPSRLVAAHGPEEDPEAADRDWWDGFAVVTGRRIGALEVEVDHLQGMFVGWVEQQSQLPQKVEELARAQLALGGQIRWVQEQGVNQAVGWGETEKINKEINQWGQKLSELGGAVEQLGRQVQALQSMQTPSAHPPRSSTGCHC